MRKFLLVLYLVFYSINIFAQKVINNPDFVGSNISGRVTKVEFTDTETIFHFYIKRAKGGWIFIPKRTYIEDASIEGKERLYLKKAEGIDVNKRHTMIHGDEIRYKLYFPAINKDVEQINYGEANTGGNWFIYKLKVAKDGVTFLTEKNKRTAFGASQIELLRHLRQSHNENTMFPKDLPQVFLGNWYDKYGTLILVATKEYLVLDNRIRYYQKIESIGENKFKIWYTAGGFEVLSIEDRKMIIRKDRLINLSRKTDNNEVPSVFKGKWVNKNTSKVEIQGDNFLIDHGISKNVITNKVYKIDRVIESNLGDVYWFVLYNNADYSMYVIRKIEEEYVLSPRGYANTQYRKIK